MRIVIIGGPRTGKTTLAASFICPVYHSDLKSLGGDASDQLELPAEKRWPAISAEVSTWFDRPGPWVIEGVAVARSLRKWHSDHPDEAAPCDKVYVLRSPYVELTAGQANMTKGIQTVFQEIAPWLTQTVELIQSSLQ